MSTPIEDYQRNLFEKIPVSQSLGVEISELSDHQITLSFPLEENINYEGTAFGGSLNTACILSCYLMLHHLLNTKPMEFKSLVIQRSSIEYLIPTPTDFLARCLLPEKTQVDRFFQSMKSKGRGRLSLEASIFPKNTDTPSVRFHGTFVAVNTI